MLLFVVSGLIVLPACSDSPSNSDPVEIGAIIPLADEGRAVADVVAEAGERNDSSPVPATTVLRVDSDLLCPTVGDTFNLNVSAVAPDDLRVRNPESVDVSARVALSASYGDSLALVAQGDELLSLRMTRRDIVGLTMDLEDEASLTVFVGGFDADVSGNLLMRKRIRGGCLYALRLVDVGFCGTTTALGTSGNRLGSGGRYIEFDGCEFTPLEGVPLLDLPSAVSGSANQASAR